MSRRPTTCFAIAVATTAVPTATSTAAPTPPRALHPKEFRMPTASAPRRPALAPAVAALLACATLAAAAQAQPAPAASAPKPTPAQAAAQAIAAPPAGPQPNANPNGNANANANARPGAARTALTVELVRPRPALFNDTLSAAGSIAPWQEASVASQANGLRVSRILVTLGNRVNRGEVMLEFDDETLRAELDQINANIAEAEAAVGDAVTNAQRARQVRDTGALSAQQVQQLLTSEATARARLQALRESARLQELRIKQARLRAPDDGTVSFRAATLGAVVPAGFELFRIIRRDRLEWRAEVPASALGKLVPGLTARVVADDGAVASGTVRLVAPTVDPATRNALVYVDLPPGSGLRPGMFARGEFALGGSNVLTLPQTAVLQRDGFNLVARVGADGRVGFSKVTVGRRQGALIEVTGGLDANAAVVATGAAFLAEGDAVRVVGASK